MEEGDHILETDQLVLSKMANYISSAGDSSTSTSTSTISCKMTILITVIVFAIRLLLWHWNNNNNTTNNKNQKNQLRCFTFRRNPKKRNNWDLKSSAPYCVVCLDEAVEGERLRKLPTCNHCFHVACIDQWFQAHSSCPLCRNQVFLVHPDDQKQQQQQRGLFFYFLAFLRILFTRLANALNSYSYIPSSSSSSS